ncbi:hypothetical protein Fcan01_17554, partial [Folsomia candida]
MPVLKVLQGSVIIIAYVSSAVCRITLFIWEKDGLLLLNGFLGFEKNLVKTKINVHYLTEFLELNWKIRKGSTFRKLIFVLGNMSCASFGIITAFQLSLSPCTPPYLVSMKESCLNEESPTTSRIDMLSVASILVDSAMYFHVGPVAALVITSFLMGFGISLQEYLVVISESPTRKSNITTRERDHLGLVSSQTYAQIQILVTQMNIIFRGFFIPALFAIVSNGIVFCLFVSFDAISMACMSYFVILLWDFLLTVGVDLASVGNVYKNSVEVIESWKRLEGLGSK